MERECIIRKNKSESILKKQKIDFLKVLPCIEEEKDIEIKSLGKIAKRAVASLLAIQLACDINRDIDIEESRDIVSKLLSRYGVLNYLLPKEKKLFKGDYTKQDIIDITWTYEAYWVMLWALGLVRMPFPSKTCNIKKAIRLVAIHENMNSFVAKCKLRSKKEILDMLDLYYRYSWACRENKIDSVTRIGKLNPDVVIERRRGLEWLISKETDWFNISLDT